MTSQKRGDIPSVGEHVTKSEADAEKYRNLCDLVIEWPIKVVITR